MQAGIKDTHGLFKSASRLLPGARRNKEHFQCLTPQLKPSSQPSKPTCEAPFFPSPARVCKGQHKRKGAVEAVTVKLLDTTLSKQAMQTSGHR